MELVLQLVSILCGLLCCVGFWGGVAGAVYYFVFAKKDPYADIADEIVGSSSGGVAEPEPKELPPPSPNIPVGQGDPDLFDDEEMATVVAPPPPSLMKGGPPSAPPPPPPEDAAPRSSGQTIIAFDDEEDDW